MRIHTGVKTHKCPIPTCTSTFSRRDNMMQHYRSHIKKVEKVNTVLNPQESQESQPRSILPHPFPTSEEPITFPRPKKRCSLNLAASTSMANASSEDEVRRRASADSFQRKASVELLSSWHSTSSSYQQQNISPTPLKPESLVSSLAEFAIPNYSSKTSSDIQLPEYQSSDTTTDD